MSKIRVGILRGGVGSEYEVSLKTGGSVLKHLPEKFDRVDILITKDGTWHIKGLPIDPTSLPNHIDVVFNCLHGEMGEDGTVQHFFDHIKMPYTGSGHFASHLGMNKYLSKDLLKLHGLKVPRAVVVKADDDIALKAREIFHKFAPPYIVKPADRGSSVGLYFVKYFKDLPARIIDCLAHTDLVMVEEYIKGREATCGVVENFRGQKIYSLLPIEIRRPANKSVFDYTDKYSGEVEEICPGNFSHEEKRQIETLAARTHEILGLRHYSRSDFIVSPRGIYVLEANTLPGLTETSLLPKALKAVGEPYPHFLEHLVGLALGD